MSPRALASTLAVLGLACAAGGASRPAPRPPASALAPAPPARSPAAAALERGRMALAEGRRGDAEQAYAEAVRLDPAEPGAHLGLARVRLADVRLQEALADATRAVELGEGAEARLLRARILGASRRFDDAAKELERVLALQPGSGEAWVLLAAVEVNRGDDLEVSRAFEEAVRALGRTAAVQLVWPTVHAMAPDPAQPQEALDRCLRGLAAQLDGRWRDALGEQTAALRHTRNFFWCGAGIAESTRRLGDLARAEALYRGVIGAFPEGQRLLRADAQGRLAALLLEAGRPPAEAIALAREALSVRGERGAVLDTLGRACEAAGDLPCAREAYRRLLERPHLPDPLRSAAETRLRALGPGGP